MIETIKKAKEQGYKFKLEETDTGTYIAMLFKPATDTVAMEIYVAGDADLQKAVEDSYSRIPTQDTSTPTKQSQDASVDQPEVSQDGSRGSVGGSMSVEPRDEELGVSEEVHKDVTNFGLKPEDRKDDKRVLKDNKLPPTKVVNKGK